MKRFGVLCMLLMILSVSLKDMVTYVKFQINRDYLTENYCVNKNAVELNCHASCYLEKEINNNHNDQDFVVPQLTELSNIVFICNTYLQNLDLTYSFHKERIRYNRNFYKSDFLSNIFRPPWC